MTKQSERMRISKAFVLVIFLICLFVSCAVGLTPKDNCLDYPMSVISAGRILAGERPYVDYAAIYGPLGHYLLALGIWPLQFLSLAESVNIFLLLCTFLYFFLALRSLLSLASGWPTAFGVLCLYLVLLSPVIAAWNYYSLLADLSLVISLQVSHNAFNRDLSLRRSRTALVLLAILAVLAVFIRLNFGFYLLFDIFLILCLRLILDREGVGRAAAVLLGSCLVVAFVVIGLLAWRGIWLPYFHSTIEYLGRYKSRVMPLHLVLRSKISLIWMGIFILLLVGLAVCALDLIRRRRVGAGLFGILLTPCLFHYAVQRFDIQHIYPLLLLSPLIWSEIAREYRDMEAPNSIHPPSDIPRASLRSPRTLEMIPGLIAMIPLSLFPLDRGVIETAIYHWIPSVAVVRPPHADTPTVVRNSVRILPEEAAMLDTLSDRGARRHPILWASLPGCDESTSQAGANIAMYLAQGILPKTQIWFFDTAFTPYPDVQRILIQDLERTGISTVAMQGLIDPTLGYIPGNPRDSTLFYDYVRQHFKLKGQFKMPAANRYYDIYVRKDAL